MRIRLADPASRVITHYCVTSFGEAQGKRRPRTNETTNESFFCSLETVNTVDDYIPHYHQTFLAMAGADWTAEETRHSSVFGDSRTCKPNWTEWLGIGPSTKQSLVSTQTLGMTGHGNNAGPKSRTSSSKAESSSATKRQLTLRLLRRIYAIFLQLLHNQLT